MDNASTKESEGVTTAIRPVFSVTEFVTTARLLIERNLPLCWIGGEISNFTRAASGHCYFVLKDAHAQVRCVLFRSKAALTGFALKDGLAVEVRALPTLYEARGEFQLNVDAIRLAGAGALYERFARLKAMLEARGWFAPERKRKLPAFPRAIGVVTSVKGAALRDVLTTLARRSPHVRVVVYPTAVQGRGAAHEIARAIRIANRRRLTDGAEALIVCRGGGSIEDLWSFNEEVVALAVIESALPVVSGVGHETDFTICDFVADVRAATPTGAAQLIVRARDELDAEVRNLFLHARRAFMRRLERAMQDADYLTRRLQHPAARIATQRLRLVELAERLRRCAVVRATHEARHLAQLGMRLARCIGVRIAHDRRQAMQCGDRLRRCGVARIAHERRRLDGMRGALLRRVRITPLERAQIVAGRLTLVRAIHRDLAARERRLERLDVALRHLNPASVLERGYAIVTKPDATIVESSAQIAVGESLSIRFAAGGATAEVTGKE